MAVLDTVRAAGGGKAIADLGATFGLDAAATDAVVAAVIPELMRKVERNTLSRGGLADLVQALGQGHHQAYLRHPDAYRHPAALADGNGILEHLLGSKDASRGVADRAARATGVDAATIRAMLPAVAGMAMGGLSKEVHTAFGDILGRMGLPVPDEGRMGGNVGGQLGIPSVQNLPGGDQGRGLPMDGAPLEPGVSADGGPPMDGGLYPREQQQPREVPRGPRQNFPSPPNAPMPRRREAPAGDAPGGWRSNDPRQGEWSGGPPRQREAAGPPSGRPQNGGVRTNPGGGLEMPDTLPSGGDYGNQPHGRQGPPGTSPFPMPQGGDNPYGDLADILRKGLGLPGGSGPVIIRIPGGGSPGGGQGMPFPMPGGNQGNPGSMPFPMPQGGPPGGGMQIPGGAVGGGLLWQIIRSVIGGAAGGFQSRGILGWIFKAVLMRYGWTILRTILGRAVGMR